MTNEAQKTKIAVIGAGAVGSTVAYATLIKGLAGELALFDIATDLVKAQAEDLNHGAQFAPATVINGSDDPAVTADADIVVMTAGARQKPGQSRLDLAGVNINITKSVLGKVREVAPNAIYILVTNPCDIITYAATKFLELPKGRVFGSGTVLDSARLRYLISKKLNVAMTNVHAIMAGEHGDSEIPLWSVANIGGQALADYALDGKSIPASEYDAIRKEVAEGAYRVIQGKGATNYAIGLATAEILEALLRDENRILPVSSVLDGAYGLSDVALSVPSLVNRQGVGEVLELPISDEDRAGLQKSAETLKANAKSLGL